MANDVITGADGALRFLDGGGELGALMRSRDWSDSPLGPPETWSPALKSTVAMMLPAAVQIVLFWGPDFVALYNDAYAPTIGDKHPDALGRPAREHWSELWDDLEPLLRRVLDDGETVSAEDRAFYIERHGHPETVYFDISYSPVRGDDGGVAGVLCLVKETTQKVLSEQRLRESEGRFRAMADSAPMPAWVTDRVGIQFANEALCEFFGHAIEALTGDMWTRLIHPDDLAQAEAIRSHAWETQQPYQFEARFRRRDGEWRSMHVYSRPRFDRQGALLGYVGMAADLTEMRRAEADLRESEARFHAMADSIDQMIWSTRPDGHHDYFNQRWYDYTGVPEGSTDGEGWSDMFHPEDRDAAWQVWRRCLETGERYHIEYRLRHRSGEYRWVLGRAQPVRDESGAIARWYGTCTDIHDLKEAQERVRQSQESFRAMVESLPIPAWVTTDGGGIKFANRAFADFAGRSAEELKGSGWQELLRPEDLAAYAKVRDEALRTGDPFDVEVRARRGDGAWRRIRVSARPRPPGAGGDFGYVGVATDLTDIRETEDALRASEAHLTALVGQAAAGVAETDLTGRFIHANDRYCAIVGRSLDELKAMRMQDITHPDDLPANLVSFRALVETDQPFEVEKRYVRPDGSAVWVSNTVSKIRSPGAGEGSILAVTIDISDRKKTEAELLEQTRNLETLNRVASELSGELDVKRVVQMVTDNGVALTGAQFGAFFYNVLSDAGESYMLFTLSGARPDQFDFGMPRATPIFHPTFAGEGVIRSDDIIADPRYGQMAPHYGMPEGHLPVRSYLALPVASVSGEVIGGLFFGHPEPGRFTERHEALMTGIAAQAAIAMDNARLYEAAQKELASRMKAEQELRLLNETLEHRVAEAVEQRAQAEEALRQAQKMETLGQLTGGVAHDFNNLLQIVSGNIGLIQRGLPEDNPKLRRAAENAARGAERAAVLTQRLLAFSRRQPLAPKAIDPNRLVGGMSELLHRTLGETIAVETILCPGLWPVEVDPHQLENGLLNLAINARDAMPDGGRLTIETCNTHLDAAYVAQNAEVTPGQYVCICVADTGSGMDEETAARAFEPFFTTKEVGKGTGLGLSMVYGFVKQSGGHLKIASQPGRGTSVNIYLPRLHGEQTETEGGGDEAIPQGGRNETILVCEDDHDVRAYTVEVLRELGYRVIEAQDGPSALRLLEHQEQSVDLLFTDVVLPNGMTGAVLAQQARAMRPDLKVLFTTGYARDAIVHHGRLDPGVELITKPFSYADLAARVRDMLDLQT